MNLSFLKCSLALQLFTQHSIASELQTSDASVHEHPKVQASNLQVKMEVRGNHDYYGHIYAGSDYVEMRMIFDTMS